LVLHASNSLAYNRIANVFSVNLKGPVSLKGPKREIFDFRVFAQLRTIWIGDLGTRPQNYKF
jgi:hypothetical protein